MSCSKRPSNPLGGIGDVGKVGFLMFPERRRHRDDDDIAIAELGEISRGFEPVALREIHDHLVTKVAEVILFGGDRVDLGLVDIEADDGHATSMEGVGERQPDVSESDHADHGGVVFDLRNKVCEDIGYRSDLGHRSSRCEKGGSREVTAGQSGR